MNSLPCPLPALCASIESAVSLDQVAGQGQADAQAALGAVERALPLHEHVEDAGQHVGPDADAVVDHRHHHLAALAPAAHHHRAARVGVLGRVGQEIGQHLGQADLIHLDKQAGARHLDRQEVRALLEQRAGHLDRLGHHRGQLHRLAAKLHPAARDARDVEQIVDQADQVVDLALDDLALALAADTAQLHQLDAGQDGSQRVAQLVAEHGQKFVLAAVRLARLLVQARVVDRHGGAQAQLLGHLQIRLLEPALRGGGDERDGAEGAAARGHRHDDGRAEAEPAQEGLVLAVGRERRQQRLGDVAVKLGAAAGHDAGHAHLGGRVGRDPAPVLAQTIDLRWIAVGHDQLAALLAVGQLDQAPVGDARHRQAGQVRQRGLVVERGRQDRAGLGEKRAAAPGGLGLAARAALDVVQAGPLQRLGALLGQRGQEGLLVVAEGAGLTVADPEHSYRPAVDDERQARQRARRRRPDCLSQLGIAPALVDRVQEHRPGVAGGLGGRYLGVEGDGGGAIGDLVGVADRAGQLQAAAVGAVQIDAGAQGGGGGHGVRGHHLEHLGLGARLRQGGGDRVQAHERVVGSLARRDVAREAARVHDLPAAPEHVGVDQHVLDGAVAAHDARLVVA